MKVRNHTAGLTARLAFKEQGLLRSKDLHQVGSVMRCQLVYNNSG